MASLKDLTNIWDNVKEIDLRPIREAALRDPSIVLVGAPGSGRHTLAEQMRSDPARPDVTTQSALTIADLDPPPAIGGAHLIILMLDATGQDFSHQRELVRQWVNAGKKVLAFVSKFDLLEAGQGLRQSWGNEAGRVLYGSTLDRQFLSNRFAPAALALIPENLHLALGRQFPLFRLTLAQRLINDTCFSNAAYALSTGIAEVVPVLDLPLNITDIVVLTKAQAFLVYRLGLLLGFSTRWQDYIAEFGSVVGSGFVWRQLARSLVGLIPVWGIIPKVAVAYSGTFVVGNAVLQWYQTGRHITREQMQALYRQAFERGKAIAQGLIDKAPRLGRRKPAELPSGEAVAAPQPVRRPWYAFWKRKPAELPVGETEIVIEDASAPAKKPRFWLGKRKATELPASVDGRACAVCGKSSAPDAAFCQYCGQPLEQG
jgi:uncharacterized protein (DUF697 family)